MNITKESNDYHKSFIEDTGIDPNECKKMIGQFVRMMHEHPDYPLRKILNVWWDYPCGYWTQCFKIEGLNRPYIRAELKEIIKTQS